MSDDKEGLHESSDVPISPLKPALEGITNSFFDELTGKDIGSFLIGPRLKVSGFSVAYHVTPKGTNQRMVMKIPRRTDTKEELFVSFDTKKKAESEITYLTQEADILKDIGSIVNVMNVVTQDVAEIDGLWVQYMVSNYAGEPFYEVDLSDKDNPRVNSSFNLDEQMKVFIQIAKALSEANVRDHYHGDLKPDNTLVEQKRDGVPFVKLIDWNSRNLKEQEERKLLETLGTKCPTETRFTMATPRYFSPEQQEGREVDKQTDVYSLGIMITECLTSGKKPGANVMKQVMRQAKKLSKFYKGRDKAVNRMMSWLSDVGGLLERMLESTSFDRPSASEVYLELNRLYKRLRNPGEVKIVTKDAIDACQKYFDDWVKRKLKGTLTDPKKRNIDFSLRDGWKIWKTKKIVDAAGVGFVNFGVLDVKLDDDNLGNLIVHHFLLKDEEYKDMVHATFTNDPAYIEHRGKTFATEYIELLSTHVSNAIWLHGKDLLKQGWKPHQYILSAINYLKLLEMDGIIDKSTRVDGCEKLNDLVSDLLEQRRDSEVKKDSVALLSSEAEYARLRESVRDVYQKDFKLTQSDRLPKI